MKYVVYDNEQLDDLQDRGYMMIQDPEDYCFTSDAVLLAKFATVKTNETVCDFCSGSGIVPTLLELKKHYKKAYLVEINANACDRAKRSAEGSGFVHFEIINDKLQNSRNYIKEKSIDVVTVNPPYMEQSVGEPEMNYNKAIARWEIEVSLEEIILESSRLLKYGGRFYMINSSDRMVDCLSLMRKYNIEPKVIKMVYPKTGKMSNVFLVEGKMRGKKGLKVLEPLYVR